MAVFLIYHQHSQILFPFTARFGSYSCSFRNVVSVIKIGENIKISFECW